MFFSMNINSKNWNSAPFYLHLWQYSVSLPDIMLLKQAVHCSDPVVLLLRKRCSYLVHIKIIDCI